jgi:hypothetical protein
MLRSLDIDPESKSFMQPKKRAVMSADELNYVDNVAPEQERDLQAGRLKHLRERFHEDVRICVETDITEPKVIAKKLGVSEQKVTMALREMRLLD